MIRRMRAVLTGFWDRVAPLMPGYYSRLDRMGGLGSRPFPVVTDADAREHLAELAAQR